MRVQRTTSSLAFLLAQSQILASLLSLATLLNCSPIYLAPVMSTLHVEWDKLTHYEFWAATWDTGPHRTLKIDRWLQHRVYLAYLGVRGEDPTQPIIVKTARGLAPEEMRTIYKEYEFYSRSLFCLQGHVVPRCYGLFKGKVDGLDMILLLLEYIEGPIAYNPKEFSREAILPICSLHEAGVEHGDILSKRHTVKAGNGVRIIDFTTAKSHKSSNGRLAPLNSSVNQPCCCELADTEKTYGMKSDSSGGWTSALRYEP